MNLTPDTAEIALRLALAAVAGAVVGLNRGEHGRPVGVRTVLLVCLSAAVAMILANLLLSTAGKHQDSFATMDPMRLPLGILSGMGFIGAGAILRRDGLVIGITTAATLWFVTIMGLCFGAGQIGLGLSMLGLGIIILWAIQWAEERIPTEKRATVNITAQGGAAMEEALARRLRAAGYRVEISRVLYTEGGSSSHLTYQIHWRGRPKDSPHPEAFLREMAAETGVQEVDWEH